MRARCVFKAYMSVVSLMSVLNNKLAGTFIIGNEIGIRTTNIFKKFYLTASSVLPIKVLGIAAGFRPDWRCRKKTAYRFRKAIWCAFPQDPTSFRASYDIVYPIKPANDDRSAASHAFKQHIGPAFAR